MEAASDGLCQARSRSAKTALMPAVVKTPGRTTKPSSTMARSQWSIGPSIALILLGLRLRPHPHQDTINTWLGNPELGIGERTVGADLQLWLSPAPLARVTTGCVS